MSKDNFKFLLGDCLEEMKSLPDKSIDLVLSDPPYNNNNKFDWDNLIPIKPLWEQLQRIVKDDGVIVLTGQQPFTSQMIMSNLEWFRYEWIWDKNTPKGMHRAKQQPMRKHENVMVFSKNYKHNYYPIMIKRDKPVKTKNMTKNSLGGVGKYVDNEDKEFTYTHKNPTSIIVGFWEANRGYKRYHPTQKPVSLMEYLIKTYTLEGDTVLDFCYGGGSTGVACVNTNRNFIGIEKDEIYYELGKARILEKLLITD